MKPESKKWSPFVIVKVISSIITIIFAVLSMINVDNWMFRILTQAALFIVMLFSGLQTLADGNQKSLGYLNLVVAAFILFVMIYTIFVGIKIGAL